MGAFFAFQDSASQNAGTNAGIYSTDVSANTFTGTPTFSGTGLNGGGLGNFANAFTAFDGSSWSSAKCAGWNAKVPSVNTWQVTLNTTGVVGLTTRFTHRLNGVQSGGVNVTALSAFEYKIGSGSWVSAPGVNLTLANDTNYNNTWTGDLSSVTAINNQPEVTLRWSLPIFTQTTADLYVRMDNLQITGTYTAPSANLTWSTATQLSQARVGTAYSATLVASGGTAPYSYAVKAGSALPTGLSLSIGGVLAGMPTVASSSTFTVIATDSSTLVKTAERAFSLKVAIPEVTRMRVLPTENYNVLFVAFDDLKANFGPFSTPEQLAAMPKPVTPNLDSLVASGMAFTRAYVQHPVCWGSRASLMTGCRPDTTKIWDQIETAANQAALNFRTTMPGIITLPQHFASQGYNVAGCGKIYDQRGTPASYDESLSWPGGMDANNSPGRNYYESGKFEAENAAASDIKSKISVTDKGEYKDPTAATKFFINKDTDYADGIMTTKAITKLTTFASAYTSSQKPFFLAIGYTKPHLPFSAPKEFWDKYDPSQINLNDYTGTRTFPTGTLSFTGANFEISTFADIGANTITDEDKARNLIHGYLAATSYADDQLGRVLAELRANPAVAAKTIIVVWGDHGYHLGDHNGFWVKHSVYEEAARAPLIICAPGMDAIGTAGKTCQSPVEFVDIYPTLVELAGLPTPAQPPGFELQGISLRSLLEDPAQPWKKAAFSQYQRYIQGTGITNQGDGMGYSIRTQRYRYTEWWRTQTTKDQTAGLYSITRDVKLYSTPEYKELYDMVDDPNQTVNLAANSAYSAAVAELSTALAGGYGWEKATVAPASTYSSTAVFLGIPTYETWKTSYVTAGLSATPLEPSADADGDGIVNMLEYAHGTDPLTRENNPFQYGYTAGQGMTVQYPIATSRTDLTTTIQRSMDLIHWSSTSITTSELTVEGHKKTFQAFYPLPNGAEAPPKEFWRLNFSK